jgi:uncharacterized repeat protein (TIGR01451 family)
VIDGEAASLNIPTVMSPGNSRARRRARLVAALVVALAAPPWTPALAGAPTLTTITVDGNFADWSAVLADPDNVYLDGPAGGRVDLDAPSDPILDVDTAAFTWDATNLYLYLHRQASSASIKYYWFFLDANNDGRMEQGEPLIRLEWHGNNGNIALRLDTYNAVNKAAGDAISNGGVFDGYKLPGQNTNGVAAGSFTGGSASGLSAEVSISWATLGLPAGAPMQIHVSSTKNLSAIPTDVADNLGGNNYFTTVTLDPDRAVSTSPGTTAILAHTMTNTGNITDTFDFTWTTSGTFAPSTVTFYKDVDGSGTLTAGDTLLTDTDGDGKVDSGPVAGLGGTLKVLVAVATPAGAAVGKSATIVAKATSSFDTTLSDTASDTVTLGGPQMTLLKSADRAAAAPGQTITYTITYTNAGNLDAQNVVVIDPVPAPTAYVAGSASGAGMTITWSHDGGATYDASQALPVTHVKWARAASLAAAASGSVTFSVTVP